MRQYLIVATFVALGFTGCTNSMNLLSEPTNTTTAQHYVQPAPARSEAYQNIMRKVASGIKDDLNYHRIALDTPEKKAWFKSLTYRLWDRQMTRQQFMTEGLAKFPTHQYEFNFIINGFAAN